MELLNGLKEIKDLSHEMRGVLYSAFGNLFSLSGDEKTAVAYFMDAKKEFMIINSPEIEKIDWALQSHLFFSLKVLNPHFAFYGCKLFLRFFLSGFSVC